MQIKLENFGPIDKCEFELDKKMIALYGENSVGKSYAMQVVYLVIKYLIGATGYVNYKGALFPRGNQQNTVSRVEIVKSFVKDEQKYELDITRTIIDGIEERIHNNFFLDLSTALKGTFGNYDSLMKSHPVLSVVIEPDWNLVIELSEGKVSLTTNIKPVYLKKASSDYHKSMDTKSGYDIYVYKTQIQNPLELIEKKVEELVDRFFEEVRSRVSFVCFLPASRSGISVGMDSLAPILAELSKNRSVINRSIQLPGIPEPIADYYLTLSSIEKSDRSESYNHVVNKIEKEILQGTVEFDSKNKRLLYKAIDMDEPLEMQDSSSMIAEIAPVAAVFKYVLRKDADKCKDERGAHIIFIEEPEAHLHPNNQIKLAKVFAEVIGNDVKLVLASHSNYFFNEFNNLVIAKQLDATSYEPVVMVSDEKRKMRSRYIEVDEMGADDYNFADAADLICEEREQLICKYMHDQKMES
jgi:predicted ATPase